MVDDVDASFRALIAGVESAHGPVVVSRYGFKVVSVSGKNYFQSRTPEEWAESVAGRSGGKVTYEQALASALDPNAPYCVAGNTSCSPMNGCQRCEKVYDPTSWGCICTYG